MKYIRITVVLLFIVSLAAFCVTDKVINKMADKEPPSIISIKEEIAVSVKDNVDKWAEGISVIDNRDGDLTADLMIGGHSKFVEKGVCSVTYIVFDHSNNVAKYTRKVRYTDYESPKFDLSKPVTYQVGSTVSISDRLSVKDDLDGDISNKVKVVSSNVNTAVAGQYTIQLEVTNSYADTSRINLPIWITERGSGVEIELSEYMIYLKQGDAFEPQEYLLSALKNDIDVKEEVEICSGVDMSQPGTYLVTYSCKIKDTVGYSCLVVVVDEREER